MRLVEACALLFNLFFDAIHDHLPADEKKQGKGQPGSDLFHNGGEGISAKIPDKRHPELKERKRHRHCNPFCHSHARFRHAARHPDGNGIHRKRRSDEHDLPN